MLFTQTKVSVDGGMYLQYAGSVTRYLYTLNDSTEDPKDQIYRDMLIRGYYGGIWVHSNPYDPAEARLNEPRLDHLEPGDILIYMNLTASESGGTVAEDRRVQAWQILVYMGNEEFASLSSEGRLYAIRGTKAVLPWR